MIFDTKLSCTWDVVNLSSIPKLTSAQNPLHGASLTHTAGRMIFNFSFAINPCLGITVSTIQRWNGNEHCKVRLAQRATNSIKFLKHWVSKIPAPFMKWNWKLAHSGAFELDFKWWSNKRWCGKLPDCLQNNY